MAVLDTLYNQLRDRKEITELSSSDRNDCYYTFPTNEHHFKSLWHRQNTIPALQMLLKLPYDSRDFFPMTMTDPDYGIDVECLMPVQVQRLQVKYADFEKSSEVEGRYNVSLLIGNLSSNEMFCVSECANVNMDGSLTTAYHRIFKFLQIR